MKVGEVHKDSGVTGEIDGTPVAVYKGDGSIIVLENMCTHLKCEVAWNKEDDAWECPCHGSKFSASGEVLRGPAQRPLRRLKYSLSDDRIKLAQDGSG